jgi:23S rRNA (guanosine2251-2'-O)-methyltransferase
MAEVLFRRNTVLEALKGGRRRIIRLWLQAGAADVAEVAREAARRGVPTQTADKTRLTQLADDSSHQGVALEVGPYPYSTVEAILARAGELGEAPFVLLLDLVQGPQNVGLLLRTAEACGVHGVIIQARRAPDISPQVVVFSAGAAEHLLVAQVANLVQTIESLKRSDVWIMGLDLDPDAEPINAVDLDRPLGLVIGHEGSGLRRLVRDHCDVLLKLPMRGRVASLNAATAGAVALYEAWRAREYQGAR